MIEIWSYLKLFEHCVIQNFEPSFSKSKYLAFENNFSNKKTNVQITTASANF